MKILQTKDGIETELKIKGSDIITGVDDYGSYVKVIDDNKDNQREYFEIQIDPNDLMYKKGKDSIYKPSEEYTILTRDLTTQQQNYSSLL